MGVPAFFRWLSRKYPSIVVHAVEKKAKNIDGNVIPIDNTAPNPNDVEFDNLYLDMNGIIHPCCHPENKPAPKNEDEMMVAIFEYIDRLFSICRPRKLLYMAIDGVAPRAKMNQQRSRRFRASKESREKTEDVVRIREELEQKGALLPPIEKKEHFDSNCITPGTSFMHRLSKCLKYYIADRMKNDPAWQTIKVILSDANVPGEGEHKIMDYIRRQRAQPDHDPNTKHCLNGADADLIMLGLATHEPHFTIIREEFKPGQKKLPCDVCGQYGHERDDCQGLPKEKQGEYDELNKPVEAEQEFIFIRLNVLREYLEKELKLDGLPFKYEFERCLDDWVFMCFFVGNDFLPHLPSLEIREGAIDRLVNIYKRCLPRAGGYVTENGFVNLNTVQNIMKELGAMEDEIFKKRQENELAFQRRQKKRKMDEQAQARMNLDERNLVPLMRAGGSPRGGNQYGSPRGGYWNQSPNRNSPNQRAATDLRTMLLTSPPEGSMSTPGYTPRQSPANSSSGSPWSTPGGSPFPTGEKRKREEPEEGPPDEIRLWEEGWRERYYECKFGVGRDDGDEQYNEFRKSLAWAYVRGLCWVLQYYYQGCPCWKWYFAYHYAPFASDFVDISSVDGSFKKGTQPLKPVEQLMCVFPAASGVFLPPTFRDLMSNPESPIIDFYPVNFKIDLNGKKYAWQGVALLPFVDEKRMIDTLATVYPDLTLEEIERNRRDDNVLFVGCQNPLYDFIKGLYEGECLATAQDIETSLSHGMRGTIYADKDGVLPTRTMFSPIPNLLLIENVNSVSVKFCDPQYSDDFVFPSSVISTVTMPERVLKPEDFPSNRRYTPQTGFSPNSHNPYRVSYGGERMIRQGLGYQDGLLGQAPGSAPGGFGRNFNDSRQQNQYRRGGNGGGTPSGRYQSTSYAGRGNSYGTSLLGRYPQELTPYQGHPDRRYSGQPSTGPGWQQNNQRTHTGNHDNRGYHQTRNRDDDSNRDPRRHSYPLTQHRYRPY